MRPRAIPHGITPPYLAAAARRVRSRGRLQPRGWEYVGPTWLDEDGTGWDTKAVVEAYVQKLDAFREAIAAPNCIGVHTEALLDCTATQYDQNIALAYAYTVARAASGRRRLSILDWGGGLGFLAFVVRELFPDLEVQFHVKEVSSIARAGREHVDSVTFWDDDTCLDRTYDLVSACASLQYSPDWRADLTRLGAAAPFLLLTRTPVAATSSSFVVRQREYGTSYLGWVFSRTELLGAAEATELALERELLEGWSMHVPGSPARFEQRGYLFSNLRAWSPSPSPP